MEARWWMLWKMTASRVPTHRAAVPGTQLWPGARGGPGEPQTWKGVGVDTVIAGSVEEADTVDPGSVHTTQGTIQMEQRI